MKTKLRFTCGLALLGAAATAASQSSVSSLFNPSRSDSRNQFNGKLWLAVFVGCAMLLLDARLAQGMSYDTSTTTVSGSPNPSTSGQTVTFNATVTRTTTHSGTGTPAGTVTFLEGATTLGTGTLSGSGLVAITTFSTNGLSGGSHTITASYAYNSSIQLNSSSGTCTQTVNSTLNVTTSSGCGQEPPGRKFTHALFLGRGQNQIRG
jgi:hypothetical protein